MNLGHDKPADVQKVLSEIAKSEVLDSWVPADWKEQLLKIGAQYAYTLAFANCDGPITPPDGRKIVWDSWELKDIAPARQARNR